MCGGRIRGGIASILAPYIPFKGVYFSIYFSICFSRVSGVHVILAVLVADRDSLLQPDVIVISDCDRSPDYKRQRYFTFVLHTVGGTRKF